MARRLLTLILAWALLPVLASAAEKVHEFKLDNGMGVLVKVDRRAPVAVSQVWYKVGSSYEPNGLTGISHALEHMMFKGTKALGPGEFSRIISALGGNENAFTGRDYTAYFETLAVKHLDQALRLEADRMHNLVLNPNEFSKEIEVVKEERRLRTEDKPTSLTYEQFQAVAWRASPYRNPVIGWMHDLDNLEVTDLRQWYERWYAPNNATLVVVGDVEPQAVLELAKRHFGGIPAALVSPPKPAEEPPQAGLTRVEVRVEAEQPYLLMGYKTPIVGTADEDWEPYALHVLASVLDGGSSARLSRETERAEGVAASAGAHYDTYSRLPGLFTLSGTPTDSHNIIDLEQALRKQIVRLKTELVSQEELQRVVTRVVAHKVYQKDSIFYQAMEIGMLETIGRDWRLAGQEVARIKAVTAEQVRAVARKYLVDDGLTIAILTPLDASGGVAQLSAVDQGAAHRGI